GTPFAYLLARKAFWGKRFVESIVDLPIVIPHPVVGIAILSVAGKNHWIGKALYEMGIRIMGSVPGIIVVLTFVGMPFYINTVKNGFENISPRLENVSRSLGASMFSTFLRITFPLAWRSMVVGMIMCSARAISEFGAVVIVAYHPMIAPVLIYERFEAYGLVYSQPVAVLLILLCLILFLFLRILSMSREKE
ncbi:MAG: ABC transporter permease, partial [Thermodesulfobacteriota bacterium]|nr:ABC transporter permease [Thermodesulfobacteriota bacterium]